VALSWSGVTCVLRGAKPGRPPRVLVAAAEGVARPGRLVALMGPSGSGKSTLLNALAGQVPRSKRLRLRGNVLINGRPAGAVENDAVKVGYVRQEDVFYSQLTARETLETAAALRLPERLQRADPDAVRNIVDSVLADLSLAAVADVRVGDRRTRGLSGGEKKRLAIGCELVASPSVLLLDEPTSGLDAFQAGRVVDALKRLAERGHTVIAVIHQPRSSVFAAFDDLVLLSNGRTCYAGPARGCVEWMGSVGHPAPAGFSPADWLVDAVSVDPTDAASREASSRRRAELAAAGPGPGMGAPPAPRGPSFERERRRAAAAVGGPAGPSFGRTVALLFRRSLRQSVRDRPTNVARLSSSVGSAVIFASIFQSVRTNPRAQASVQDRFGLLQVAAVNTAMGSVTKTLSVFPSERTIVDRERGRGGAGGGGGGGGGAAAGGGYGVLPYLCAKLLAELPVGALFPAAFGALVYPACGLARGARRFLAFLGVCTLESFAAQAVGLAVGAAAPTADAAQVIGPLTMVVFIVFGGFYVGEESVPRALRWAPRASLIRHAFEALAVNEMRGLAFDAPRPGDAATGEQALARLGFGDGSTAGANPARAGPATARLAGVLAFAYWATLTVLRGRRADAQPMGEADAEADREDLREAEGGGGGGKGGD